MAAQTLNCPKCSCLLDEQWLNRSDLQPCPNCQTPIYLEVFPAFFRKIAPGQSAQLVMAEGESGCFFHPQKKAVVPCAGCGRFLCALCDCDFNGQHFCPACLETGKSKGKIQGLENQRARYDSVALMLAFVPVLITALVAMFLVIRCWKTPTSLVGATRPRLIAAIVIAALQIVGWATLIIMLATHH
jgi:hypothetical protein